MVPSYLLRKNKLSIYFEEGSDLGFLSNNV